MNYFKISSPVLKTLTGAGWKNALMPLVLLSACGSNDGSASTAGTGGVTSATGGASGTAGQAPAGNGGATTTAGGATSGPPLGAGGMVPIPGAGGRTNAAGQGGALGGTPGQTGGASGGGGMATSGGMTGMAGAAGAAGTAGAGGGSNGMPQKSAGCGKAPPSGDKGIMVGSATGNYTLDVPTNYDNNKAYPLILVWHGAGVTGTAFHGYLDMHKAVGNDGIVVTPECLNGGSTWPNDASYADALLAHFEENYCVDKGRLFTTGHSMGGMHTGLVGCLRGDVFRGDAVLAAPHPGGACKKGTMAAMMSVGMTDPIAKGTTEFAWWAMENGCNASMTTPVDPMSFYGKALDESGTCVDYGGCGALTPLRTCTFNGGHEIPPWVASAVWDFFKKL